LISSIAIFNPRVIASPDCAEGPDKAATCPILIASAAKLGPVAISNANAAADRICLPPTFILGKNFIAESP
jgi:hypothetical protein